LASGVAVNVTVAPASKPPAQVAPPLMPAGLLETLPLPVPVLVIVNVKRGGVGVTAFESADVGPVPAALFAATLNV